MKAKATVLIRENAKAYVRVHRESACASCHGCPNQNTCHTDFSLSDKPKTFELYVDNPIGANVGDTVEITSENIKPLVLALMVFILPLLVSVAAYLIASAFSGFRPEFVAMLVFLISFLLFSFGANRFCKDRVRTTVTKIVKENGNTP